MGLNKDVMKNLWWDIELFRIVHGRLPDREDDRLTKKTAKEYLDRFHFGTEKLPSTLAKKKDLDWFAFHVYASTNLDYENDLDSDH